MPRRVVVTTLVAAYLGCAAGGCSSDSSSPEPRAEAGPADLGVDGPADAELDQAPDPTPDVDVDVDTGADAAQPCTGDEIRVYETRVGAPTPGAITLVVGVESCAGAPLTGLAAQDFTVLEDGTPATDKPALLPRHPEVYLSLLIDASPSLKKAGAVVKTVIAAKALVDKVMTDGVWISVTHFADEAELVLPFSRDKAAVHAALEAIADAGFSSDGVDLCGTLVDALEASALHRAARQAATRDGVFALGQLLLFTDGTDKAATKTLAETTAALSQSDQDVVTVGFGAEVDAAALKKLGTHGSFTAQGLGDLKPTFTEAAARLVQLKQRIYVLGHCSAQTKGEHTLAVAAAAGQSEPVTFDATGFDAGTCSASSFTGACDGLSCGGLLCGGCSADLLCTANGLCTNCDGPDVCKIDEQCLEAGQLNPLDACQRCDPAHATDAWKTEAGTSCGDQCVDLQTDGDHCGACGKSCKGDPCVAGQCTALVLASATAAATSLAVEGDEAFWTEGDEVKKVATTGGTPAVLVTGEDNPRDVHVLSQAVIWIADKGSERCLRSLPPGTPNALSVYCSTFHPTLASDGAKIKFVWGSQVGSVGPAGGLSFAQTSVFGGVQVVDLHFDGGLLYWIDGGGTVGTDQKVLTTSSPRGTAITVVGGKPYWARIDAATPMKGTIMTVGPGGSPTEVATDQQALGLATDGQSLSGGNLYWANTVAGGAVMKLDLAAATPPLPLQTGEPNPRAVVVSGDHVYWLSDAAVRRVAK